MPVSARVDRPQLRAPAGACDCHMHVFDQRFGPLQGGAATPPAATATDYLEVQQALGLQRVIVVQANGYGFDNRAMLDAMAIFGADARGVAVVGPDTPDAEMQRLTDLGVRGARLHLLPGGALQWSDLEPLAARVRPFGWHLQLQFDGWTLPQHFERLRSLEVDCVIDHIGKFLGAPPPAPDDAVFNSLLGLLDGGRCWIKLSSPYESSRTGPPGYDDVLRLARRLAATHGERCLWASNWPHPGRVPQPSSAAMLDLLLTWADDAATRQRILVDNPAALYDFEDRLGRSS
ncbi:amidohydrolase family protein [Piscinibacter sakaiensis]|uniref:amidohydrolase family protein n=1 Tax=Piscinibacter sakaiensis TaxID=1547922 RepID=UPI003AAE474C